LLLEKIVPDQGVMEDYEVEHAFPHIGKRSMLLNARKVFYEGNTQTTILSGIEDVTDRRAFEREREELLDKQQALLSELERGLNALLRTQFDGVGVRAYSGYPTDVAHAAERGAERG
jgi:hypothetical protein